MIDSEQFADPLHEQYVVSQVGEHRRMLCRVLIGVATWRLLATPMMSRRGVDEAANGHVNAVKFADAHRRHCVPQLLALQQLRVEHVVADKRVKGVELTAADIVVTEYACYPFLGRGIEIE